ncbi:MAG: hypothetical protein LBP87_04105 [Planctomycetaceae bacterium]|jgi:hypothetical protein|nr:hypothetical protein [Planctomycetaceae bacterium]
MTSNKKITVLIVLLNFVILILAGCGGPLKPDGLPALYPVTLVVTQDGKPVTDMIISLRSTDPEVTWAIGCRTDENGHAPIRTHGEFTGVPLGKYKVVLAKQENEGYEEYVAAKNRYDEKAAEKIDVKFFSCVEEKYNAPETTPIEIEITPQSKIIEIDAGPLVRIPQPFMR